MYSRKLVLAALAGGLLMTTTLSAQGNHPTTPPKTVGASILTNGGFEDPTISTPVPPTRPKDYPKDLVPQSSSDTFYDDEETKEGGIAEQIKQYGEDEDIKYTEAQLKEFKTFVEEYIAYLKKKEDSLSVAPYAWDFSPTGVFSHKFIRATKSPAEGKSYVRLETYSNADQKIIASGGSNNGFSLVNSKAQYLISFKYRGNRLKNVDEKKVIAYVLLDWKAKNGTKLKLDGQGNLTMHNNVWSDTRKYTLTAKELEGKSSTWKDKYFTTEAPENAEMVKFTLMFPANSEGFEDFRVDIDDISMKVIEGHEGESNLPKLVAPKAPTAKSLGTTYIQREFAVQWEKSTDAVDGYEVEVAEVNGTATQSPKTYTTTGTSYTFEGMEPGKTYQVRVRSTKGEAKSEYSPALKVQTQALGEFTQDGIPFLSTVSEDGSAPQNLPLYFLELKNPEAKLTCFIDDQEVAPTNKILQFPSTGNHTLRIIVEEAADRIWELSYELNIK